MDRRKRLEGFPGLRIVVPPHQVAAKALERPVRAPGLQPYRIPSNPVGRVPSRGVPRVFQ
jgi:hypothetical protein